MECIIAASILEVDLWSWKAGRHSQRWLCVLFTGITELVQAGENTIVVNAIDDSSDRRIPSGWFWIRVSIRMVYIPHPPKKQWWQILCAVCPWDSTALDCTRKCLSPGSYIIAIAWVKGLVDALLDNPQICGFCYTQLTDIEQEQNGLYTYDRVAKFEPEIIAPIVSRKAAIEDWPLIKAKIRTNLSGTIFFIFSQFSNIVNKTSG